MPNQDIPYIPQYIKQETEITELKATIAKLETELKTAQDTTLERLTAAALTGLLSQPGLGETQKGIPEIAQAAVGIAWETQKTLKTLKPVL